MNPTAAQLRRAIEGALNRHGIYTMRPDDETLLPTTEPLSILPGPGADHNDLRPLDPAMVRRPAKPPAAADCRAQGGEGEEA